MCLPGRTRTGIIRIRSPLLLPSASGRHIALPLSYREVNPLVPKRGLEPPRPCCWASDSQSDVATITPLGHYNMVQATRFELVWVSPVRFERTAYACSATLALFFGGRCRI